MLFVVSTTSLCCVAQLSAFLGQTSALQHLHLTLEKVRIQNTFLCQVFSFAKAVCFTEPPPAAGSLWGAAISSSLISQCRTAASQPGQQGEQGSAALCLQLPHQLPGSTCSKGQERWQEKEEGRKGLLSVHQSEFTQVFLQVSVSIV